MQSLLPDFATGRGHPSPMHMHPRLLLDGSRGSLPAVSCQLLLRRKSEPRGMHAQLRCPAGPDLNYCLLVHPWIFRKLQPRVQPMYTGLLLRRWYKRPGAVQSLLYDPQPWRLLPVPVRLHSGLFRDLHLVFTMPPRHLHSVHQYLRVLRLHSRHIRYSLLRYSASCLHGMRGGLVLHDNRVQFAQPLFVMYARDLFYCLGRSHLLSVYQLRSGNLFNRHRPSQ